MKGLYFFIMLIIMSSNTWSDIYKSVDAHGNVKFSDIPSKGAIKITLPELQSFTPKVSTEPDPEESPPQEAKRTYKKVSITRPFNEETIRRTDATIEVAIELQPKLFNTDKIQLMFDGMPVGKPQRTTFFTLNNVNRGAHTLLVNVMNEKNEVVGTSSSVRFFMQTPRVNNNFNNNVSR